MCTNVGGTSAMNIGDGATISAPASGAATMSAADRRNYTVDAIRNGGFELTGFRTYTLDPNKYADAPINSGLKAVIKQTRDERNKKNYTAYVSQDNKVVKKMAFSRFSDADEFGRKQLEQRAKKLGALG